jgi:hypothetical protein
VGAAPVVLPSTFLHEIETYDQFEQYLDYSTKTRGILVIDVYIWAGPCNAIVPVFKRLAFDLDCNDKPVRFLRLDATKILASVVTTRAPAMMKKRQMTFEDLEVQETNVSVLRKHSKSCKPTFLMYAAGKLRSIIEGVDVVKFERQFRTMVAEITAKKPEEAAAPADGSASTAASEDGSGKNGSGQQPAPAGKLSRESTKSSLQKS